MSRVRLPGRLAWRLAFAAAMTWPALPVAAQPDDPYRLDYEVVSVREVSRKGVSSLGRRLLRQRDRWVAGRSEQFQVLAPTLRQVSAAVEEAEFAHRWLDRWFGPDPREARSLLFLVGDADLWRDIVQGHGLRHDSLAMQLRRELYLKDDPEQNARPDRIAHEVVHVRLFDDGADPLPLWLEEGLAGYLGWSCAVEFNHRRGVKLYRNLPAVPEERLLSLEHMLGVASYPPDPAATQAFYRQSEEWIDVLAGRIGPDGLRRLIAQARRISIDHPAALQEATGLDADALAGLEAAWRERCRKPLIF